MNRKYLNRIYFLALLTFPAFLLGLSSDGCEPHPGGYATLTVEVTGQGTVNPSGGSWPIPSTVTLQALPASGWKFDKWEGGLTGTTNPQTLTLTASVTVKATFISDNITRAPEAYNLTATTSPNVPITIQLQGEDPDGLAITYQVLNTPSHGNISFSASDGKLTYIPNTGYAGFDTIEYKAKNATSDSDNATVNFYVVTPASSGWAKSFGSTESDRINAITADGSGNVYVAGKFTGTVDFDPGPENGLYKSAGKSDAFLTKFDATGQWLWTRTFGGSGDDAATAVAVDGLGNVYLAGTFTETFLIDTASGTSLISQGGTGAFLCKFKPDRTFSWAKAVDGNSDDGATAVTADALGIVYLAGYFSGQTDFDGTTSGQDTHTSKGQTDGFVTQFAADGAYGWTRILGGTLADRINGIGLNGLNLTVAGYFQGTVDLDPGSGVDSRTSAGKRDIFIVQLTTTGQQQWSRILGSVGEDQAYALAVNEVGNIAVGGAFQNSFDFNPGAGTDINSAAGETDGFVAFFTSTGDYQWTRVLGGTKSDFVAAVSFDSINAVYAAGAFTGSVNFARDTGTDSKTSEGQTDAFLTKILIDGTYAYTLTAGGTGSDEADAVSASPAALAAFWGGYFQNTADLDPRTTLTSQIEEHTAFGSDDAFLIKSTPAGEW